MDSASESSSEIDGYEQDGFVVPDEPIDDEVSEEEALPKKRRTRLRRNDQEDLDLVKENLGLPSVDIPLKKPKNEESSSDESLEPGEIPDVYNEGIQLAASIFGTSTVVTVKDERKLDFEPAEKREKFIRNEDDIIREYDFPERLQHVFKNRESPTEYEIQQESEWLLNRIQQKNPVANPVALQKKLSTFLFLYRIEKYEIPFISRYRMNLLKPELDTDLWELYSWDKEWGFLHSTKLSMKSLYDESEVNRQLLSKNRPLDSNSKVLTHPCPEVESELKLYPINYIYHISDLEHFFKVHIYTYSSGKLTTRSYSALQEARQNNITLFTHKAAITPEQFSENLESNSMVHTPCKNSIKPQDQAFELLSNAFADELQVINTACFVMKSELAGLPSIRRYVRELYVKYARICTAPTEKGRVVLNVFNPYYRVKNLAEGKYANTWTPDMWAEVVRCEELGLITVEFKLPWESDKEVKDDRILDTIKRMYLTSSDDEIESDWNHFRLQVLKQALQQIYDETAEVIRKDLTAQACEWVKAQVQSAFFQIINLGKIKKESGKLLAMVTDPDIQNFGNTYLAVINNFGEVVEVATFNTLTVRKEEDAHDYDKQRAQTEKKQLCKIFVNSQPDAVLIAANSLQALTLRKNVMQVLESLLVDNVNEREENEFEQSSLFITVPPVYMLDPQVPKLFASSQRGKRLFPEYKIFTKMAISLARLASNPCAETLSLYADPNEVQIKYLNLHPLQSLLPENSLLSAIEIVALDYVSAAGVYINDIMHREHLSVLLAFVPGLGPVKAHGLIEKLKQVSAGKLLMRGQLIGKRVLGHRVYDNAAGFIRIPFEERESDPLDSTRIHPESYELAKVIARSVFSDTRIRDENLIQEVMSRPQKMQDLDLDKYAEIHFEKTGMNIKEVLESIVAELTSPYQLAEKKIADLPAEELFYFCTGENKNTLRKGSIVQVQVIVYDESKQMLKCRLECGLEGIVDSKLIPEKKTEKEGPRFIKKQVITARVIEISPKVQGKDIFFRIRLSLMPDDIIHHGKFIQLVLDDAFVMEDADWIEKAVMEDEYKTGQKYVPRVVNHPKFKNVGLRTACEELFNKDIGECLFRPSSRGQDHLTCTWKFYDFIYSHLDVIEEGKPALNMLGTKFRISTDVFESLQEIIDRYVCPCAELTKEAISHPKFKDSISGGSKLIETLLIQEKRSRPTNIPYYFTIRQEYPQYLVLYYLPKEEITVEYIKVKPKGFFFHEAYHPNINFLISWFKRHYNDRTYKSQLVRSKAPIIDTSNHLAIAGKLQTEENKLPEPSNDSEAKPQTPRNLPDATPYNKTPHIGYQEWAGGKDLTKTPRADDWEMSRNYDSWVGDKTPARENETKTEDKKAGRGWGESSWGSTDNKATPNQNTSSWGAENSAWGDSAVPDVPKTNWDEERPRGRGRGERGERGERGDRGRGRGCRKCGQEGHFAKDCTVEKKDTCFKCGQEGHMSKECTNAPDPKLRACFKCSQTGHMSRDCTNPPDPNRPRRPRGRGRGRGGSDSAGNDDSAGWNSSNNGGSDSAGWGGGDSGASSGWGDSSGNSNSGWGGSDKTAPASSGGWGTESNTSSGGGWGGGTTESSNTWGAGDTSSKPASSGGWGESNPSSTSSGGWAADTSSKPASGGWGGDTNPKPASSGGWGGEPASNSAGSWGSTPAPNPTSTWGDSGNPVNAGNSGNSGSAWNEKPPESSSNNSSTSGTNTNSSSNGGGNAGGSGWGDANNSSGW